MKFESFVLKKAASNLRGEQKYAVCDRRGKRIGDVVFSIGEGEYANTCILDFNMPLEFAEQFLLELCYQEGDAIKFPKPIYLRKGLKYFIETEEEPDINRNFKKMLELIGAKLVKDDEHVTYWWQDEDNWVYRLDAEEPRS